MFIQIILGLLFLFLSLIIFTAIGFGAIKILKVSPLSILEKYTLSTIVGLVIFTLLAYILALSHLRFLMWSVPLIGLAIFLKFRTELFRFNFNYPKKTVIVFLAVLIPGVIGQVAVNALSGFPYPEGYYFWSSHGHDGIWHIALMEEMKNSIFPFQNPEYAGHRLQNYHFFVDLLMSEVSRLFKFSNFDIYFRFIPVLFSLLLGLGSFIFVRTWSKSFSAGIWAMVFVYFAGSFGYLLTLPRYGNLNGEAIFWVSQTQSVLGNPPHAAAFIILTAFLYFFYKYLQSKTNNLFFLTALLGGAVIEFKVYAGTLILGGLLVVGLWEILSKRHFKTLLLFFITLALSLILYLPNNESSQEFLIWEPWWFIRTMVVVPDRLNWLDMELRRQTYLSEGNIKRVIQLETTALLIFLFGNLGMRFLGFLAVGKYIKGNIFKHPFNLFFLSVATASFLLPVLFVQKGVAWNVIQYNQYFLLFFGFLAAVSTSILVARIKSFLVKFFLSLIIIVLAVPTQIGLLWQFYSNQPLSKVTFEEVKALEFLRENSNETSIILTAPFNKYERDKYYPPVPIYSWYDTGYISAFSGRRTWAADQEQVDIMGYKADDLFEERKFVFKDESAENVNMFLGKYKIDYVYLPWGQKFAVDVRDLNLKEIYRSQNVKIYQRMF